MVFVHIRIECLREAGDLRVRFFVDVERCAVRPVLRSNPAKPDTQRLLGRRSVHARLCQCYVLGNDPATAPKKVSEAGFNSP